MTHIDTGIGMLAVWTPIVILAVIATFTYVQPNPSLGLRVSVIAIGSLVQLCVVASIMRMANVGFVEALRFLFPRRLRTIVA